MARLVRNGDQVKDTETNLAAAAADAGAPPYPNAGTETKLRPEPALTAHATCRFALRLALPHRSGSRVRPRGRQPAAPATPAAAPVKIHIAIGTPTCTGGGRREHPVITGRLMTAMGTSTDFPEGVGSPGPECHAQKPPGPGPAGRRAAPGLPAMERSADRGRPAGVGRAGERLRSRRSTGSLRNAQRRKDHQGRTC